MIIKDIIDLESVLRIVGQISQEQAWAICYNLVKQQKLDFRNRPRARRKIQSLEEILLDKEGFVQLKNASANNSTSSANTTASSASSQSPTATNHHQSLPLSEFIDGHDEDEEDLDEDEEDEEDECERDASGEEAPQDEEGEEREFVASLGIALFRALDYGIADDEERKLSLAMEYLIYQSQTKLSLAEILDMCTERLTNHENPTKLQSQPQQQTPSNNADQHYREICRNLIKDTIELSIFLDKIYTASMVLRDTINLDDCLDNNKHLHHLNLDHHHHHHHLKGFGEHTLASLRINDWARLWMQVMKELRQIQLQ